MKRLLLFFIIICINISFGQFFDNFEYYFPEQPVACQKPEFWTTFNQSPCDQVQDPYVSDEHAYSGSYSLKILPNNNLIKPYDGVFFAGFNLMVYIPSGKSGYFSLYSSFYPNPNQLAMECYFDADGTGRIVHGSIDTFSWSPDTWYPVSIYLDVPDDVVYFYWDNNIIATWQWSQGGLIDPQLEAINLYGAVATDEMYADDFSIWDGCLSCGPPDPPYNLTAEEIFNQNPAVNLNWQSNSMVIYGFNIIRKTGYPNDPGNYEYIGNTPYSAHNFVDSLVTVNERYTYGVVTNGQYGFSDTSNVVTILIEPTPVELTSFSYSFISNDITLYWITATETNNKGFDIQRLKIGDDPAEGGSEWSSIGFVEGNGTTTEEHSYSISDKNVIPGKYKYRLKQLDFDGTFEYSKVIEAEAAGPGKFSLEQNYPNPFNPSTNISYSIPRYGLVTLKVYNTLGEEVATLVNEEKPAGVYTLSWEAGIFPSGGYFYQLKSGDPSAGSGQAFIQTKKMILLK